MGANLISHIVLLMDEIDLWGLDAIVVLFDIVVFALGYITTKIDPSDRTVRVERYARLTYQPFNEEDYEFYCHICEAHVQEFTKHCGRCNRCCANFDHHCVWLNNCVGGRNYRVFFMLIVSVLLSTLLTLVEDYFSFYSGNQFLKDLAIV